MKFSIFAAASTTLFALSAAQNGTFTPSSCGTERCLPDGQFEGYTPTQFGFLCQLPQADINEFVTDITPCLMVRNGSEVHCTAGGASTFVDILTDVCNAYNKTIDLTLDTGNAKRDRVRRRS